MIDLMRTSLGCPHLTAPNRAPSHSFFRVSTVFSGRATPFFLNSSKPASRWTKEKSRPRLLGKASRIFLPAGITSRPMPSPGSRPEERLVRDGSEIDLDSVPTNAKSPGSHCVYVSGYGELKGDCNAQWREIVWDAPPISQLVIPQTGLSNRGRLTLQLHSFIIEERTNVRVLVLHCSPCLC